MQRLHILETYTHLLHQIGVFSSTPLGYKSMFTISVNVDPKSVAFVTFQYVLDMSVNLITKDKESNGVYLLLFLAKTHGEH
jgi:hypothetical protein